MSCLFDSLASEIADMDGLRLRQLICDYLSTNPVIFEDDSVRLGEVLTDYDIPDNVQVVSRTGLASYVQHMRCPSTWGGALEIRCFCDIFGAQVHVFLLHQKRSAPIVFYPRNIITRDSTGAPLVFHLSYNGVHYEPAHAKITSTGST